MTNGNDEPEWLLPIDLMVDSYAPEQIADELGRRHALYLREAQRLVLDKLAPDEGGLAEGVREETRRYLTSQPWLGHASVAPAVSIESDARRLVESGLTREEEITRIFGTA